MSIDDVLIVDDEAVAREMLREGLTRDGFRVTVAADGAEALELIESGDFQLIVSDWDMPRMNGIELCRKVRSLELSQYIYIIMLTAHGQASAAVEGLGAGADDFVTKPFSLPEVVCRLRSGQRLISLNSAELTIFMLARLAESRDPETGAHLERVRRYARILAEALRRSGAFPGQIGPGFTELIFQTSPLHDIGKVSIPDNILLKPGRLTHAEFEIMKSHATNGAQTLSEGISMLPSAEYLRMAHDIALTHHERYNGEGYPGGLHGDEIPLAGRIVALADVFDALTSRRVYKPPIPVEEVHEIIVGESGKHFDPLVVEAYIDNAAKFRDVLRDYADEHEPPHIAAA